jgi:hypothetical protein
MKDETHFELAVTLSRDALKSLLIVNGGAATALIALMDKANGSRNYTTAILLFGAGTVGAVMSACFGYFSQLNFANHIALSGNPLTLKESAQCHKKHRNWQGVTIVAVLITIGFMIAGIVCAAVTAHG